MPELPEVETVVRCLRVALKGLRIESVDVYLPKVLAFPDTPSFQAALCGKVFLELERRGKYIIACLTDAMALAVHLRMSGQLVYELEEGPLPKHTHIVWHLNRGRLRFTDPRQFGRVWLVPSDRLQLVPGLRDLGTEPLDNSFRLETLANVLSGRKRSIKAVLLDQTLIAGLGNIYTDEALYRAQIHPMRPAGSLTARETHALYQAIREVLREGIAYGGTSIRDYVDGTGQQGSYQNLLRVYGRSHQACSRCGQPIARTKVGGRGTYFCPRCQPEHTSEVRRPAPSPRDDREPTENRCRTLKGKT
ncbi:MAG: bifunctional DNA-formamidopyrimidine glycosylase/DNA-(apurinic or apyrimidinic site) lyase [Desulfotomaculales bacterium]